MTHIASAAPLLHYIYNKKVVCKQNTSLTSKDERRAKSSPEKMKL